MPALDLTFNTDGGGFEDAGRLTPRSRGGRLDSPRADIVEKCSGRGVLNPKYYTGHVPSWQHEESDALETPLAKECVVGYQGHLHGMRNTFGQTFRDARHDTDLRASGLGEAEHIHRNMLEARATARERAAAARILSREKKDAPTPFAPTRAGARRDATSCC